MGRRSTDGRMRRRVRRGWRWLGRWFRRRWRWLVCNRRRRRGALRGLLALALSVLVYALWLRPTPPTKPDDACAIFRDKPSWYDSARQARERWRIPEAIQLAVIHRESGFRAGARTPRRRILWILPGPRISSARGYAQALDGTWRAFQAASGRRWAWRGRFNDATHFVAWYLDEVHRAAAISRDDPYRLYLAYHEGPAGYARGSHRAKPWLLDAARGVAARAARYEAQLAGCADELRWRSIGRRVVRVLLLLALALGWGLWLRRRRLRRR